MQGTDLYCLGILPIDADIGIVGREYSLTMHLLIIFLTCKIVSLYSFSLTYCLVYVQRTLCRDIAWFSIGKT